MIRTLIIAALLALIAFFVIYNNTGTTTTVDYQTIKQNAPSETPGPDPADSANDTAAAEHKRLKYAIGPVICPTADTGGFRVKAGITLLFADTALQQEVRLKSDNIVQLIRYHFQDKPLHRIHAGRSRQALIKRLNAFLASGTIDDLIFTAFDIVPRDADD